MQELQIKPDYHAQIMNDYNEIMQMLRELKAEQNKESENIK